MARNAKSVPRDVCNLQHVNISELELSDEHMAHVYRFCNLGPFDRNSRERLRGYIAWKISNKRLMDECDANMTADELEQQRIEADEPNCWMCGGDGECAQYNEEAGYEESFTCSECFGTGAAS